MKKLLAILFLGILAVPFGPAQAQVSFSAPGTEVNSTPAGNVPCFDYYKFGSVDALISPVTNQTVPGTEMYFKGKIKNNNDYPLVNGTLYVKIFERNEEVFNKSQDGYPVIEQFPLEEKFTLPAQGEKEFSFAWKVPMGLKGGNYFAATFFATESRYNLLGLSFTDDVVGNQADFSVTSQVSSASAAFFDKNEVTLNDQEHSFVSFPLHFGTQEAVTAKVKLVNPTGEAKVVPVVWRNYAWDSLRPENLKSEKAELVQLAPNETKELSYAVNSSQNAVTYLVVETEDKEAKSFLNIRFVRDGIAETRINFPSILKYPLVPGEENAVFACAHSTNDAAVSGNTLTLTLRDMDGNVIHKYRYDGNITGAMGGWKDDFMPEKYMANFTLTATLEREGQVLEDVVISYDCKDIDENLCKEPSRMSNFFTGEWTLLKTGLLVVGVLLLVSLLLIGIKLIKSRRRGLGVFFLGCMFVASGLALGSEKAEAAQSTTFTTNVPRLEAYRKSEQYCYGCVDYGDPDQNEVRNQNKWVYDKYIIVGSLSQAAATVSHSSNVKNNTTGVILDDSSSRPTVSVGDSISFLPAADQSSDISWVGTGSYGDSPYGRWSNSAPAACDNQYRVGGSQFPNGVRVSDYIALSVAPTAPRITHSGTAGLSCTDNGFTCTVTSAGTIDSRITYPATSGKFHYSAYKVGSFTYGQDWHSAGCLQGVQAMQDGVAMANDGCTVGYGPDRAQDKNTCVTDSKYEYKVAVPDMHLNHQLQAVQTNQPPNSPTIAGPTAGSVNTAYSFAVTGTDPDGDSIVYEIDWNNDGSHDTGSPYGTFVASGTTQNFSYAWATAGTHTFQARTLDSKGSRSGWTQHTVVITVPQGGVCGAATAPIMFFSTPPTIGLCAVGTNTSVTGPDGANKYNWQCQGTGGGATVACQANYRPPAPVVDLKINSSDGPLTVTQGTNLNITWGSISNATSCTGSGNGWGINASKSISGGNENVTATAASLYTLTCTGPGGTTSDSVSVTIQNTLKVCQSSCSSNIQRGYQGETRGFTMVQGSSQPVVACWNTAPGCSDAAGNITTTADWGDEAGVGVVGLPGTDPKYIEAYSQGTEKVTAHYQGNLATMNVTVTCVPTVDCSNAPGRENYCKDQTFTVDNGCGTPISCSGSKTCDYNWKEVAP